MARFISLFLLILFSTDYVTAQVNIPEGELYKTKTSDLAPGTMSSSYFNELWTYQIYLEDDLQIYIVYTRADFGRFRGPVSGARMSVIGFEGDTYQVAREFALSHSSYDQSQTYFRLHQDRDIWFRGNLSGEHQLKYKTSKDGVDYDVNLTLYEIEQGYRWYDGIFRVAGDRIGIQIPIPRSNVRGTVSINGVEKSVRGTAYMDKTFQTNITPRIFNQGFRYVEHAKDGWEVGIYLLNTKDKSSEVVGYGLRKSDASGVALLQPVEIRIGDSSRIDGSDVTDRYIISFKNHENRTIRRIRDRERSPFLNELSGFQYRIARAFLGGEMIEFRGDASRNESRKGYYNFFIVE